MCLSFQQQQKIRPDNRSNAATKTYQNIELLPALGKVDLALDGVRVADVDKGEIL